MISNIGYVDDMELDGATGGTCILVHEIDDFHVELEKENGDKLTMTNAQFLFFADEFNVVYIGEL